MSRSKITVDITDASILLEVFVPYSNVVSISVTKRKDLFTQTWNPVEISWPSIRGTNQEKAINFYHAFEDALSFRQHVDLLNYDALRGIATDYRDYREN